VGLLGEDLLPPIRGPPGSWLPTTRPARLVGSEIRAPATLVDAISYATADGGSIPPVSTSEPPPSRGGYSSYEEVFRERVSSLAVCVRRLVVGGKPDERVRHMRRTSRQIDDRVQAARDKAIIRYVYGRRVDEVRRPCRHGA
jgi:hypothetical protein